VQRRHDDSAQRRHHHEVENDGELEEGEQASDEFLVAGKGDDGRFGGFIGRLHCIPD
jgi:hypothetical protein